MSWYNENDGKYICLDCHKKQLVSWYNDMYCLHCKKLFKRDDLMERLKELGKKRFEIVFHGFPDPDFRPGGISHTTRIVKCPLCEHVFSQRVSRGCFGGSEAPNFCPKCKFYFSTQNLYWKLIKVTRKKEVI